MEGFLELKNSPEFNRTRETVKTVSRLIVTLVHPAKALVITHISILLATQYISSVSF